MTVQSRTFPVMSDRVNNGTPHDIQWAKADAVAHAKLLGKINGTRQALALWVDKNFRVRGVRVGPRGGVTDLTVREVRSALHLPAGSA